MGGGGLGGGSKNFDQKVSSSGEHDNCQNKQRSNGNAAEPLMGTSMVQFPAGSCPDAAGSRPSGIRTGDILAC